MPDMATLVAALASLIVAVGVLVISVGIFYLVVRLGRAVETLVSSMDQRNNSVPDGPKGQPVPMNI